MLFSLHLRPGQFLSWSVLVLKMDNRLDGHNHYEDGKERDSGQIKSPDETNVWPPMLIRYFFVVSSFDPTLASVSLKSIETCQKF